MLPCAELPKVLGGFGRDVCKQLHFDAPSRYSANSHVCTNSMRIHLMMRLRNEVISTGAERVSQTASRRPPHLNAVLADTVMKGGRVLTKKDDGVFRVIRSKVPLRRVSHDSAGEAVLAQPRLPTPAAAVNRRGGGARCLLICVC